MQSASERVDTHVRAARSVGCKVWHVVQELKLFGTWHTRCRKRSPEVDLDSLVFAWAVPTAWRCCNCCNGRWYPPFRFSTESLAIRFEQAGEYELAAGLRDIAKMDDPDEFMLIASDRAEEIGELDGARGLRESARHLSVN